MNIQDIMTFLARKEVLIAIVALLVLLIVVLVVRNSKKKAYRKQLQDFQVRYNNIKSIPLTFKMSKVVSLSKMDAALSETIDEYKEDYESIQNNFKNITDMLAQMEDEIVAGKLKSLKLTVIDLDGLLANGERSIKKLDDALNIALKPETDQREEINLAKEQFRELKNDWNMNNASLAFSADAIIAKMENVEKKFTEFEENMYASEYDKAKACNEEINQDISNLKDIFNRLPNLLQEARGIIPKQIDQIAENYALVKQKGVFLQHLDVAKNVEILTDSLKQDLQSIKNINLKNVDSHFADYKTRLVQLNDQINKEDAAFNEVKELSEASFRKLDTTLNLTDTINNIFVQIEDKYGFDNLKEMMPDLEKKNRELTQVKDKLAKLVVQDSVPSTTVLLSLKEFNHNVESQLDDLKAIKSKLDEVRSDEERARKQLLKFYLIMNEIQVKIRCYKLPAVSEQYEGDVKEAYRQINTLQTLLAEKPINTTLLSATLNETIDFVYKLYNNVNNIVGMAQMVENTIVFANKYRSSNIDLDSELARSELSFRNGEYTQALTIAINAVEKLKLDSYESLIKENAASAA
ncbi:MAG: hypothetical protein IKE59_08105 [Erysipelotrichaceae bacterium]|nr:hypothetical protein [Erysipelotrichaceae bacterium]